MNQFLITDLFLCICTSCKFCFSGQHWLISLVSPRFGSEDVFNKYKQHKQAWAPAHRALASRHPLFSWSHYTCLAGLPGFLTYASGSCLLSFAGGQAWPPLRALADILLTLHQLPSLRAVLLLLNCLIDFANIRRAPLPFPWGWLLLDSTCPS